MKHRYLTATCTHPFEPRKARGSAMRARQQLSHKPARKPESQDEPDLLLSDSDDGGDQDDLDGDYKDEGASSDEDEAEDEDEDEAYVASDDDEVGKPKLKPKPKPKPCKRDRADAPAPLSPEELEREFKRRALAHAMNELHRCMC
jgi:hypothetical protein